MIKKRYKDIDYFHIRAYYTEPPKGCLFVTDTLYLWPSRASPLASWRGQQTSFSYYMHAIIEVGGEQIKVKAAGTYYVPKRAIAVGEREECPVLWTEEGIGGGTAVLVVEEHVKADKVLVFKKKRRKGYQKACGHRQTYTRVRVESLSLS